MTLITVTILVEWAKELYVSDHSCMVPNAPLLRAHVHAPTSIGPHQQLQVSTTTT